MIRPFEPADAAACVLLTHRSLKHINASDYPQSIISHMIEKFDEQHFLQADQKYEFFVYDVLGVIATIALDVDNQQIKGLFVDPDYVRQGVGSQLLHHIEDCARDLGLSELRLHASLSSVEFYRKNGYERQKNVSDTFYGEAVLFTKQL